MDERDTSWRFTGTTPHSGIEHLPPAPAWRSFGDPATTRGATYRARRQPGGVPPEEVELVNAALLLRRPLLITGKPGTGKSSLAYAVAKELGLGAVLRWPITTRSTLHEGLYDYDAIGRLQDANLRAGPGHSAEELKIGKYIRLGPLGTALLPNATPRVLLVDEIDKSDVDLPNDLLHVFEEGEYEVRELARLGESHSERVETWDGRTVEISGGRVYCSEFPLVVFTSNGERDFPPAFLRRCLRLTMQLPGPDELRAIVRSHFEHHLQMNPGEDLLAKADKLIEAFLLHPEREDLATDQLLNAVYLVARSIDFLERPALLEAVWKPLSRQ